MSHTEAPDNDQMKIQGDVARVCVLVVEYAVAEAGVPLANTSPGSGNGNVKSVPSALPPLETLFPMLLQPESLFHSPSVMKM